MAYSSPPKKIQGQAQGGQWWSYFQALRPRQWTKNLLIFAAPLFAFELLAPSLLRAGLACLLFCGVSSSFYLINDIVDVKADRQHPVKCNRPIAAGRVPIPVAIAMAIGLLVAGLLLGWAIAPALGGVLWGYALLQLAYNWKLKRLPIFDLTAIALGFVLRAVAGAAATGVSLSPWFILCTALLALFLAVEKRKAELRLADLKGITPRSVLRRYSLPLLHRMENTVSTGAFVSYALWSAGPSLDGASTPWMMLTLPFVLVGIFRYQLLSDPDEIARRQDLGSEAGGKTERPEEVLLGDLGILLTVLGWIVSCLLILLAKQQGWIA